MYFWLWSTTWKVKILFFLKKNKSKLNQKSSVYWKKGSKEKLKDLNPTKTLSEQLQDCFSVPNSPIWMDSSTSEYCKITENQVGGSNKMAEITGSVSYERFTMNQILKIFKTQKLNHEQTERISLVSSFICSLLIGDYASIDTGDGSGMNLMDLKTKEWNEKILNLVPELGSKLGKVVLSHTSLGTIHPYFTHRYGFTPTCICIAWSGDNPCSLSGLRMREGDIAISLGTSDTMFGPLSDPHPSEEGHVFCDPIHPSGYMALLCYKNGSLTREYIR